MKAFLITSIVVAASIATTAFAQSGHSKGGHSMEGHSMEGHVGSDHKGQQQMGIAATGSVDEVTAGKRQVKITHAPIKALGWPAMTMDFNVAEGVDLSAFNPGDEIGFTMMRGADGIYMIQSMTRQ